MRRRQLRWRTATILTTTAFLPLLILAPAHAAPADSDSNIDEAAFENAVEAHNLSPADVELLERQERLNAIASDIQDAAEHDQADGSGLAGIAVDLDHNELHVYWHGDLTEAVKTHIDKAPEAVTVESFVAPYTRNELLAEIDRISARPLFNGKKTGQRTMSAAPAVDGTGINVAISGLPSSATSADAPDLVPALDSPYPLAIAVGTGYEPTYRWIDFPAHRGGAVITQGVGTVTGVCTTGFGVTGLNGTATYMLTAAHCGEGTWRTGVVRYANGATQQLTVGTTIAGRDTAHDGQAILTPNKSGPYVYVGDSVNPSTGALGSNTTVRVSRAANSFNGELVCNGGAYSGTICGIRVATTGLTIVYDPPHNGVGTVTDMVQAETVGTAAGGSGDSGAPIYAINSDGTITARGIQSGVQTGPTYDQPCVGYKYTGRVCSSAIVYGEVLDIMSTIGVRINT